MNTYGKNEIGRDAMIFPSVILGFPSRSRMGSENFFGVRIGRNAVIRPGTTIYCDVEIGDEFQSGHNVLVREETKIGDRVSLGTGTVVEGNCTIGNDVRVQSMVFIPTNTTIGNRVFIGPAAVLTNDRYPPLGRPALIGPHLLDGSTIGANATILPGIIVGEDAVVAAGATVTKDVPPRKLAIGSPSRFRDLPGGYD